jgi:hypothetical protein
MASKHFIPGLELSQMLYEQAVQSILAARFAGLAYSAALLGSGSEVLGFDTPQSMDHDWGPRLMLFLDEVNYEDYCEPINQALCQELPAEIHGYPVNLASLRGDATPRTQADGSPVAHNVTLLTLRGFFGQTLKIDPDQELRLIDWLTIPQQFLRSFSAGRVFHDGLGRLEPLRARLRYYPRQVWLYLLAVQWRRVSQEEALMGRCGQVGDELGSRLVAARLVRDLMLLCFLMERQYAPYIKWLGTAFQQLDCAEALTPILGRVLSAASWQEREGALSAAYEFVARMHNDLGLTEALPGKVSQFHQRPFMVIHAERFAEALYAAISDEGVRALPPNLGAIDQFVDSTDVLAYPERFDQFKFMY